MHKTKGMGRTRLTRFAAVTIPAAIASGGLAVAVLQGAVSATLSSANSFELASPELSTDSLALRPGVAPNATSDSDATAGAAAAAYAETGSATTLNGLCLGAKQSMPSAVTTITNALGVPFDTVGVQVTSGSSVSAPNVGLNAASLDGTNSSLSDVDAGVAQSTQFTDTDAAKGYQAGGFALTAGATTMQDMHADSYAVHLDGLDVTSIHIKVNAGKAAAGAGQIEGGSYTIGATTYDPAAGKECAS